MHLFVLVDHIFWLVLGLLVILHFQVLPPPPLSI